MESLKRLASVRRTPSVRPTTSPGLTSNSFEPAPPVPKLAADSRADATSDPRHQQWEPLPEPPRIHVERADSIIVDMSDPTAAMASAAADMVVSLVRRAKSTRETRRVRRSPSTTVAPERELKRPQSLDLPSHPAVRPVPQRRQTVEHAETRSKNQLEAPSTGLKKRPSLRDRLKSRLNKPAAIIPAPLHEEPAPKTPTDTQFVFRPKHAAVDLTTFAPTIRVPRDSQDTNHGAQPAPLRRSSTEKSGLSLPTSSTVDEKPPVVLVDAPYPSPPLPSQPPTSPRAKGECSRCHSKRVQRDVSVRKLTGELPPRISVNGHEHKSDPLNDYQLFVASEKQQEATSGGFLVPQDPTYRKGHTKQAPSWASYHDGDSDGDKVKEHRKSQLQPLISVKPTNGAENGNVDANGMLQAPVTVKRQRSVAQRIVDKFRGGSRRVKPGVQRVLTA